MKKGLPVLLFFILLYGKWYTHTAMMDRKCQIEYSTKNMLFDWHAPL